MPGTEPRARRCSRKNWAQIRPHECTANFPCDTCDCACRSKGWGAVQGCGGGRSLASLQRRKGRIDGQGLLPLQPRMSATARRGFPTIYPAWRVAAGDWLVGARSKRHAQGHPMRSDPHAPKLMKKKNAAFPSVILAIHRGGNAVGKRKQWLRS